MAATLYPLLFSEHFVRHRLAERFQQDLESLRPRAQQSWDALGWRAAFSLSTLTEVPEG